MRVIERVAALATSRKRGGTFGLVALEQGLCFGASLLRSPRILAIGLYPRGVSVARLERAKLLGQRADRELSAQGAGLNGCALTRNANDEAGAVLPNFEALRREDRM